MQQPMMMPPMMPRMMPPPMPPPESSPNLLGIIIICCILYYIWITFIQKDGSFSDWSSPSRCSKSCGGGIQTKTRKYIPPQYGGKDLSDKDKLTETIECNTTPCVVNAKMSTWENSGNCYNQITTSNPIPCGGLQKQIRNYIPPENGGKDLPISEKSLLEQIVDCETKCTDMDGQFTDWVDDSNNCYSGQSDTSQIIDCGNGYKKQIRTYIPATGKGKELSNKNELTKYINCQLKDCPPKVDGYCDSWINPQNECTCINDTYKIIQTRKYNPPIGGGKENDCKNNLSREVVCKDNPNITDPKPPLTTPGGICPSNHILTGSIEKNESNCKPITGTNRTTIAKFDYTFPFGTNKEHHKYIKDNFSTKINELKNIKINEIKEYTDSNNNKVKFTRKNSTIPEKYSIEIQYKCPDIDNRDENSVKDLWVFETNCKKDNLNNTIYGRISTTLDELKKIDTNENVRNKFRMYNVQSLTKNNNRELIKHCYGTDSYLKITENFKDNNNNWYNKLYPGTDINIENSSTNFIVIIVSGDYALKLQKDGNLILYNHKNNTALWTSGTNNKGVIILRMQWNGNLVLYDKEMNPIWVSHTYSPDDNNGTYLEITNKADLILRKSDNEIVKILTESSKKQFVIDHLKTKHWSNSPWTLFSDKKGRVWKATWGDLDKDLNINYQERYKVYANTECGGTDKDNYCPFRGWYKSKNDSQWKVTQRNLQDIEGYDRELNNVQPIYDGNNDEYNYNSASDRRNFENIDKYQIRKPPQLKGGIEKPNYIPGYRMLSYSNGNNRDNTFNFLVSDRCGTCMNQAFIVYQKYNDKDTYANQIYNNHPELVEKILNAIF